MRSSTEMTPADRRKREKLAELLVKAKDHVMSPAEIDAQRKSWVCGEMLLQYPNMTYDDAAARYDAVVRTPTPVGQTAVGRWLPITQADKTINHVTEFTQIGLTLKNSDTYWVRDEDGRTYQAAWSEGNNGGRDYWWDWEGESPVDPVEFMPHPLDPKYAATEADRG